MLSLPLRPHALRVTGIATHNIKNANNIERVPAHSAHKSASRELHSAPVFVTLDCNSERYAYGCRNDDDNDDNNNDCDTDDDVDAGDDGGADG